MTNEQPEREPALMYRDRARAESFGAIADAYDRHRPSYPEAMIVDLLMTDPHDVLDVGCGTGKAARLFAARGMDVLGVEIDDGMASVARRHGTDVEVSDFEGWDDRGRRFDLLISGQAWHWVDPVRGAGRAREVLRPGRLIALFWNMSELDEAMQDALDDTYAREAPVLIHTRGRHGGRREGRGIVEAELTAAGFVDVGNRDYPWQRRYTRDEWLALLGTHSDHQLLPPEQRAAVISAVGDVIDRFGGSVVARYDTHLITGCTPL